MNIGNRKSQHSFAQIPSVNTQRSKFDRSFAVKDTFNFDELVPIMIDEIIPGDTMNLTLNSFTRLATQTVPVMDNMYIDYFFFFVPSRLVWDKWENFNGAQDNPDDSTDYLIPTVSLNNVSNGSIYDHFGIPTEIVGNVEVNALPFRAYNLIWNEWFRDQNLQDSVTVNKSDSGDVQGDYTLLKRGKRHDYFTSALPWPQKGDPISLPLGTQAPVYGHEPTAGTGSRPDGLQLFYDVLNSSTLNTTPFNMGLNRVGAGATDRYPYAEDLIQTPTNYYMGGLAPKVDYDSWSGNAEPLPPYADLSEATAATINQFRQAIMMQSLIELDARGGTRYVEILKAHFNVVSPDFRLQRPEFLSSGTTSITQHPVPQTSESNTTAQATLAAYSTAAQLGNNIGFSKSFTEHGYVIGLVQARGDITYQQGLNRMWSRSTRWDFFWPKLQMLGEQAILNKEIYLQADEATTGKDLEIFGYQERYAEYRYKPSEIRGQFRSNYATSLDVWHIAEEFGTLPALNSTFIESNTPIERSLAVTSGYPHLLFDAYFKINHVRPMVTYGVPATLGRF